MLSQNRALLAGFAGAVLAACLFAWLAGQVLRHETIRFDAVVRGGIHSLASPPLTRVMETITWMGSELVLVPTGAGFVFWLAHTRRRHAAVLFLVAAVGSEALDEVLKLAFRRVRPEAFFGYALPSTYSFPSGHSLVSCCFFGVMAAILTVRLPSRARRAAIWAAAAILALAIGCSRIYLGVHYPSDVLAGYAAAVAWVAGVRGGYEVWLRRRPKSAAG